MSSNPAKKLFNVYEFHKMEDAGILSNRDRVELVYGEILVKAVPGPPHNASLSVRLGKWFVLRVIEPSYLFRILFG